MIKCSNIKKLCKHLDLTVGLDAYSRLNDLVIDIVEKAVNQAKSGGVKKLRDYHFDGIEIRMKKRAHRKKEEVLK